MAALFLKFARDESGATAIEYGLICSLIFLVIVTSLYTYQKRMGAMYDKIGTAITSAGN